MDKVREAITSFCAEEDAATAVEYAIMVTLIGLVVIGAVTALGLATSGLFQSAVDSIP